jgi:Tol biopolymer transport system component
MAFERRASRSTPPSDVYVATAAGGDVTRVTPQRVAITPAYLGESWEPYEFSPDGDTLLIAANGGMIIAKTDGGGVESVKLDGLMGELNVTEPSFRPPDGHEILFVGKQPGAGGSGLYVVDLASREVRTLVAPRVGHDLAGAEWAPDGSRIAYWAWTDDPTRLTPSTHVILPDGTGDRQLPTPDDVLWNAGSAWSNDGTRLLIAHGHSTDYTDVRLAIAPADGSQFGTELDTHGTVSGECCMTWEWAPDDSWIIVRPVDPQGSGLQQIIIDLKTGVSRDAAWTTTGEPSVQRVAR